MISENLIYFQHRDGIHDYLVSATEFRTLSRGTTWNMTLINDNGHHTFKPTSRDEAINMAREAVRTMLTGLNHAYGV